MLINNSLLLDWAHHTPNHSPTVFLGRAARAKENGEEFGFGYRMRLVSDATHGVPLAFTITPANGSETTELPVVLRKTLAAYPWIEPASLLADRGYDSQANHRFLAEQDITPVIHIRKPTAADGLRDGIYTAEGKPTCLGGREMEYVRTDPETGHHLFRCPAGGCRLKTQGTRAVTHCDAETWERPEDNLRASGSCPDSLRFGSAFTLFE